MLFRRIVVAFPAYNEGRSVHDLLKRIATVRETWNLPIEVVAVDDCSTDDTPQHFETFRSATPAFPLHLVRHGSNGGLGAALNTLLHAVGHLDERDVLITLDGDASHPPELIPQMIATVAQGADIVIASRYCEQSRIAGLQWHRRALSRIARLLYFLRWRLPGVRDYTCLFRAYRGSTIQRLRQCSPGQLLTGRGFVVAVELLLRTAPHAKVIAEVPLILRYDAKVKSSNMKIAHTIFNSLCFLLRPIS